MSYNLQYRIVGTGTWTTINTTHTSAPVSGLHPSTIYEFAVQQLDDVSGLTSDFTTAITASSLATAPTDSTPDAFTIPAAPAVIVSTLVTSAAITLTGYTSSATISVSGAGAKVSVAGGAYTTSTSISPGQSFAVQLTASSSYLTAVTATVVVAGVSANFVVTTSALVSDTTPDGFVIPSLSNAALNSLVTSAAVTVAGYNTPIGISVAGGGSPRLSVGGGSWTTSTTINPGQSFVVQLTSSSSALTSISATVTAGGVSAVFSATTMSVSISWSTAGAIASLATPGWSRVFYGGGKFIALNNNSTDQYIGSSTSGYPWITTHTGGAFNPLGQGAYGAGLYVVLNYGHNTYKTSPNGTTWTTRTLPTPDNTGWRGIYYVTGVGFVAISDTQVSGSVGQCITSPDGLSWTTQSFPVGNFCGYAYGGGTLVATSYSGNTAIYSTDAGVTWTTTTLPSSGNWFNATYGNGMFVAIKANSNVAASSPDGITWTAHTLPASSAWSAVGYGNGHFVAAATATASGAISMDGLTWLAMTLPSSHDWQCFAFGNGWLMLIASDINTFVYSTT